MRASSWRASAARRCRRSRPPPTAVDLQAEATSANGEPRGANEDADEAEPVLPPRPRFRRRRLRSSTGASTASCRSALTAPVAGDKVIPLAQRLRRAGSKPVNIEGKLEGTSTWELLKNGARYEELRAAAQLANRSGALNELEFSEFVTGVQRFADAIDGAPEFPPTCWKPSAWRANSTPSPPSATRSCRSTFSPTARPWSANYVQAVASQDGLLLSRDGTRFVKLDAKQNPVFMLQFGDTNFCATTSRTRAAR